MKKLFFALPIILLTNYSYAQSKDYVTFQAVIANKNNEFINITLLNGEQVKRIELNANGVFKDTLKVKEGMYRMYDGVETTELYLKNGYNLKLKMDAKQFDESIIYSGKGALENNLLAKRILEDEQFYNANFIEFDEIAFESFIEKKKNEDLKRLNDTNLDTNFIVAEKSNTENSILELREFYFNEKAKNQILDKLKNSKSPSFDYVNHKGGKTKLEDFVGKYVYIDVWATWCGPCRAEIPFLKKTEEKYHGKNIEFVSISIDVDKDLEKWRTFVTEKELGGTQLFADKNWNSDFIKSFGINGIPRFILIDPQGNVVDADALRPSDPDLEKLLDSLLNKI